MPSAVRLALAQLGVAHEAAIVSAAPSRRRRKVNLPEPHVLNLFRMTTKGAMTSLVLTLKKRRGDNDTRPC
jgi:hypothetical protein